MNQAMEDVEKPRRAIADKAWRLEQQAKRRAYEAKRRAWAGMLERGGAPGGAGGPEPDSLAAGIEGTDRAPVPSRHGRQGGTVHDRRQARFPF